jgi:hypothetical protein
VFSVPAMVASRAMNVELVLAVAEVVFRSEPVTVPLPGRSRIARCGGSGRRRAGDALADAKPPPRPPIRRLPSGEAVSTVLLGEAADW